MTDKNYAISIIQSWDKICAYKDEWDNLVDRTLQQQASNPISGIDGTQRFAWVQALVESRNLTSKCSLITIHTQQLLEAIVLVTQAPNIERNAYSPVSDLYSGRTNLLVCAAAPNSILLQSVFKGLDSINPKWTTLSFYCCTSAFVEHWYAAAAQLGYTARPPQEKSTPFVELPQTVDELVASRPKKFRYLLRNSEKQLSSRGELGFWHSADSVGPEKVIDNILEIERSSWKEEAGTSITTNPIQEAFYRSYLPDSLASGQARAYFLTLDGRCIAYVFGLLDPPMFCDLKESYVADLAEFSPSHVLKLRVFQDLIANKVSHYDFMGDCEPYKMKWGAEVYQQYRVELYNNRKFANFVRSSKRYLRAKFRDAGTSDF